MEPDGPTYAEVYYSWEYQQYLMVLDDEAAAFYYAKQDILAARAREALPPVQEQLPFSEWYRGYLTTPEWRDRAASTYERFGNRCALCNSSGNLQAHHRTYEHVGDERPDDLTALCADCHAAYHAWRRGALPGA